MAAPSFISAGAIATDVSGGASTTPGPPTHQADDILLAVSVNANGSVMSTGTAGWNEIPTQVDGTMNVAWFWKRATAAGTAGPTITANGTDQFAVCYVIRGCIKSGTPFEDATVTGDGTNTDTTPDTATIDTTEVDRFVICALGVDTNGAWTTAPPPTDWATSSDLTSATGTTARFTLISRTVSSAANVPAAVIGTFTAAQRFGAVTLAFLPPIYAKTGVLTSAALSAGSDVFEANETGAVVATSAAAGERKSDRPREGSLLATSLLRGVSEFISGGTTRRARISWAFLETPVPAGGLTYAKVGVLTAPSTLLGADVFEASEAGALTAQALAASADIFEAAETGALLGTSALAGTDVFEATEAGVLLSTSLLAGTDAFEATESGTLLAGSTLAGVRVLTFERLGALVADSLLAGADVFEAVEAGSLKSAALLAGADVFEASEMGTLLATSLLAGVSEHISSNEYVKTGALASTSLLTGPDAWIASEAGSLAAGSLLVGTDVYEAAKTGALVAVSFLAGVRARDQERAGSLTAGSLLSASDVYEAVKAGALIAGSLVSGSREWEANRLGALLTQALLSGGQVLGTTFVMLDPVTAGIIARVGRGVIDGKAMGRIVGETDGDVEQAERGRVAT